MSRVELTSINRATLIRNSCTRSLLFSQLQVYYHYDVVQKLKALFEEATAESSEMKPAEGKPTGKKSEDKFLSSVTSKKGLMSKDKKFLNRRSSTREIDEVSGKSLCVSMCVGDVVR